MGTLRGRAPTNVARAARLRLKSAARYLAHRPAMALRRRYYVDGTLPSVVGRLPAAILLRLGLADDVARSHRRIEIGGGPFPRAGYVHVDADPNARHLEAQAFAWDLPFPDNWADEILSIHTLEHVHPRLLQRTLREWHRVLAGGGAVRVHVPNSPALMEAYLAAEDDSRRWMLSGALLGMYGSPAIRGPDDIPSDADHQILFDRPLLFAALQEAGFVDLEDLTEIVSDRHTDGWKEVVDRCSIVAHARKAAL
jgi:SAM-dependent methyltransferase